MTIIKMASSLIVIGYRIACLQKEHHSSLCVQCRRVAGCDKKEISLMSIKNVHDQLLLPDFWL